MDALIIGHRSAMGSAAGQQLASIRMHAAALRRKLGVKCRFINARTLDDLEHAIRDHRETDIAVMFIHWAEPSDRVHDTLARISSLSRRPYLVLIDYFDQTSSPFFDLLPLVDRYVKRQVLRDRSLYHLELHGGYVLTDYLVRRLDYHIDGWQFGAEPPQHEQHKLTHGWNVGITPWYRRLLLGNRMMPRRFDRRRWDINIRLGPAIPNGQGEWFHRYREAAIQQVQQLSRDYHVTGRDRLGRSTSLLEMRNSRIVVSPFGCGELCLRDFEAICSGALLIKPSVNHLVTSPDIFYEHETYVPVHWDLSDLADACRYYLDRPQLAQRVAHNAQQRLTEYFDRMAFVDDFRRSVLAEPPLRQPGEVVDGPSPLIRY